MSAERDALGGYLPIGDYALIGDERTTALVARDGSIDWWCWPDVDSPAVLCRLLDGRRGGFFQIAPSVPFTSTWRYVPDTNVLETTFTTESGRVRLTDFLALSRGTDSNEVAGASRCLGRLVEGIDGVVTVDARFRPTFDYARHVAESYRGHTNDRSGSFAALAVHCEGLAKSSRESASRARAAATEHRQPVTVG